MDLIADIGATNGRFGLPDDKGRILAVERYKLADYGSIEDVLRAYLAERRASDQPKRAVLAVAAPIVGDEVAMVNRGWRFSQAEVARSFGLSRLQVINDF